MKTENVAESHQTDIPYTFPAGHETKAKWSKVSRPSFSPCGHVSRSVLGKIGGASPLDYCDQSLMTDLASAENEEVIIESSVEQQRQRPLLDLPARLLQRCEVHARVS